MQDIIGPSPPPSQPLKPSNDLASLRKVATEFEALFLGTLLKSMRATVPESELFGKGGATKLYRQWHDEELARSMARSGDGLGIREMLVRQFQGTVASDKAIDKTSDEAFAVVRETPRFARIGATPTPGVASIPPPVTAPMLQQLASYREQGAAGGAIAAMVRLRRLADNEGGAVADSLDRYQAEIWSASQESGVDPALLLAVLQEESGGDPQAVSARGAVGLMQLMPATAAEVGVRRIDDPGENIRGGARYLARMLHRFEGRYDLALGAYNAGPGAVEKSQRAVPPFPETQRYVRRVLDLCRRLGGPGTDLANFSRNATALPESE